ncbi:hypothetical protein J4218_04320 [Candidatus Pacearchaeota archaeon]|nr:hypothetical protein [Candidatus Pacearchaeota archaeon]
MKTFSTDKYTPIDYLTWILGDEARKGANIKRLGVLRPRELKLLEAFVPYQDCRNDPGHGEISTLIGIRLLDYLPGIREIVVPAVLGHDTGWYGTDPDAWKRLVEANKENLKSLDSEVNRRPHQNRGIIVSGRIFQKIGYPDEKYHFEIADIIGDHDTRKLPTTDSGRIMRIADLLWRVTYPCVQIYMANLCSEEIFKRVKETCIEGEKTHLGEIGLRIGRLEFANTMFFKFGKEARKVLLPEYKEELERIVLFSG